jgi:hypothetical protein
VTQEPSDASELFGLSPPGAGFSIGGNELKRLYLGDLSEFGFSQSFLCKQGLGASVECAAAPL